MNTMTLSLPYIKTLKNRLNEGQHLNVLCILHQYLPFDPDIASAMMRHLTAHASRHASHKMALLTKYQQIGVASLLEDEQQVLRGLLSTERADIPRRKSRVVIKPHRSRRPLNLGKPTTKNDRKPRFCDSSNRKRSSRRLVEGASQPVILENKTNDGLRFPHGSIWAKN